MSLDHGINFNFVMPEPSFFLSFSLSFFFERNLLVILNALVIGREKQEIEKWSKGLNIHVLKKLVLLGCFALKGSIRKIRYPIHLGSFEVGLESLDWIVFNESHILFSFFTLTKETFFFLI